MADGGGEEVVFPWRRQARAGADHGSATGSEGQSGIFVVIYIIKCTLSKARFLLQSFSMDIMRHKDAVDDIVKTGEAIMNSKDEAEKQALRVNISTLIKKGSRSCVT